MAGDWSALLWSSFFGESVVGGEGFVYFGDRLWGVYVRCRLAIGLTIYMSRLLVVGT